MTRADQAAGARSGPSPRRLAGAAKIILSIGILAYVFWLVPMSDVLRLLRGASPLALLAALLLGLLTQLVAALRFASIAVALGATLHWARTVRVHFVGLWMNQLLPTSLGGDVVRVVMLRQELGTGVAIRVGILDRISGLLVLLIHVALFGPLYASLYPEQRALPVLSAGAAVSLLMLAVLCLAPRLQDRLRNHRATAMMGQLVHDVALLLRPPHVLWQLATSLAVHLNGIAAYLLIAHGLGICDQDLHLALLTPVVFLIALLPLSYAGWGLREVGAIGVFGLAGIAPSAALAITVVFGLMTLVIALPGLWFFVRSDRRASAA